MFITSLYDAICIHIFTFTCSLLLLVSMLVLGTRKNKHTLQDAVPGPEHHPFLGIIPAMKKHWEAWPSETSRLCKLYDCTWGGDMLPAILGSMCTLPPALLIVTAGSADTQEHNLRHILRDKFDNYIKGNVYIRSLSEILGEGIFAVDGEKWRLHRKVLSNMFSRNLLRYSANITMEKLLLLCAMYREKLSALAGQPGKEKVKYNDNEDDASNKAMVNFTIDIQDVFFRLTFDTTTKLAFGVDLKSIERGEQHKFARAFDEIVSLSQERWTDLFFGLKKCLGVGKRERRIRVLKCVIDDFSNRVIEERRERSTRKRNAPSDDEHGFDILSKYIEHAQKANETVSDQDLKDLAMNVILAGRDTTACALSWTFFELTRNPHVIGKIKEEVNSVCGVGEDAQYTYDTMNKLRYTHCVALEVLRLHPSVPIDSRKAVSQDTLPDGTHVPAGTSMQFSIYAMGRSENIWGDDAEIFRPERFMEDMGSGGVSEPSSFKYSTFFAGPRMCLGKPLALMTMKMTMSILLTSGMKFEDRTGHSGEYLFRITSSMKGGFPVSVAYEQ